MGDGYAVPRYAKCARQECNETPIGFSANGWGLVLNLDTGSPSATHSGLGCPGGGDADENFDAVTPFSDVLHTGKMICFGLRGQAGTIDWMFFRDFRPIPQ